MLSESRAELIKRMEICCGKKHKVILDSFKQCCETLDYTDWNEKCLKTWVIAYEDEFKPNTMYTTHCEELP